MERCLAREDLFVLTKRGPRERSSSARCGTGARAHCVVIATDPTARCRCGGSSRPRLVWRGGRCRFRCSCLPSSAVVETVTYAPGTRLSAAFQTSKVSVPVWPRVGRARGKQKRDGPHGYASASPQRPPEGPIVCTEASRDGGHFPPFRRVGGSSFPWHQVLTARSKGRRITVSLPGGAPSHIGRSRDELESLA